MSGIMANNQLTARNNTDISWEFQHASCTRLRLAASVH